jgi:hypothetical protein
MSSLQQRLRAIQTPIEVEVQDLSHLTLEELSQEKVSFGQKHLGQPYAEAWKDQEWVTFMVSRYGGSTKLEHRRFMKYIDLKVTQHETHQMPIPVVPPDSVPLQPSAKACSPGMIAAAKPKARGGHSRAIHLPDMEEGGWSMEPGMEPGMYTSATMTSGGKQEMEAMQQRILNMENALTRVIRHLETQHGTTAPPMILGDIRHRLSEDWEADIFTVMPSEIQTLKRLIQQFEKELRDISLHVRPMGKPITLIEVFCSERSPLTHQVNQLGQTAQRFGYSEADLATSEGRSRLFSSLIRHRPKHLWVSPDCGPWSSWAQLNESRSLESQQEYATRRHQLLYQLALCIVLFRHQAQRDQDFHWEQPARSLMLSHPGLAEIHAYTKACQFDMCRAGELRCPLNGMFMKRAWLC